MVFTKLDTFITVLEPKSAEAPSDWVKLGTRHITLTPAEAPSDWVKLDTMTITLIPTEAPPPPPPPPPPPEEEKKFPWAPVLIGGGIAVATIGIIATERGKRKEK